MGFDRISEEIAHFIGLFQLEIEGLRLRLDYERFSHRQQENALESQGHAPAGLTAPHVLKGFDPGLSWQPPFHPLPPPPILRPDAPALSEVIAPPEAGPPPRLKLEDPVIWTVTQQTISGTIPPPNPILVSISQTARMWDDDLLLVTGVTTFIDLSILHAEFGGMIAFSRAAGPLDLGETLQPSLAHPDAVLALMKTVALHVTPDGLDQQMALRGDDAQGSFLDGTPITAEDLPVFRDLLPALLAPATDEDAPPDPFAWRDDGTTSPHSPAFAVDPGHLVVTGGNLAMNEATIIQAWVDAPVIAVAGDAIRLDVVSQINILYGAGRSDGWAVPVPSQLVNAVSRELISAPASRPEDGGDGLPGSWSVVRITGDVIAVNLLQQYVFGSDADRIEVSITAAATYISTGENILANGAILRELGFHYDLILIGGSMVTLNLIEQVNLLWDADLVAGAAGASVDHHAGDNLQMNLARISQTGIDQTAELPQAFREALDGLGAGGRGIGAEVARDGRFEGLESLRVLYIEGDFITANIIQQHNFLNDTDQLAILDQAGLTAGAEIRLVTGSNAQLNAAQIQTVGMDSEILVGGSVYSDALIFQARLLDEDAPPTGVSMMPLANEAVAFLAEDMLTPQKDHSDAPLAAPVTHDPASGDLLHALIA